MNFVWNMIIYLIKDFEFINFGFLQHLLLLNRNLNANANRCSIAGYK